MNSDLPQHVQAARRDADAMIAMLKGDTGKEPAADEPKDTQVETTPEAQEPQPKTQSEPWEARFHSLRGKYDAEVPRLTEHIRSLEAQIAQLQQQQAQTAQVTPQEGQQTGVNRGALEEYDAEFGKLVDVIEQQKQELGELKAQLAKVTGSVQQVHQTQAQDATARFWAELEALVPDHDAINRSPEFIAWLEEEDGFSGLTRKQTGQAAMQSLDHRRVARMFNEFKSHAKPKPKAPQSVQPETRSTPTPTESSVTGETYTREEVDELYKLRERGSYPFRWKGRIIKTADEAKMQSIEITQAGFQGRIL